MFKQAYDIISPFLLKLYNIIFESGKNLSAWDGGIIVPIFKDGNTNDTKSTEE
jgi:hypothetical protein